MNTPITLICCLLGVGLLFYGISWLRSPGEPQMTVPTGYSPCCSFPCQNGGTCMEKEEGGKVGYECDCANTDHYGSHCETPHWGTWFSLMLKPSSETTHYLVTHFKPIWNMVNMCSYLRRFVMRGVLKVRLGIISIPTTYRAGVSYPSLDGFVNQSFYGQTLPPVPHNCPTPMGTKGPKELPPIDEIVEKLFKRNPKRGFKPSEIDNNMLFVSFAQHFIHMFCKTYFDEYNSNTWSDHNIYASHLYGQNTDIQNRLRQFKGGLMRTQVYQGEEYPPFIDPKDNFPVHMPNPRKVKNQFLTGHSIANMLPMAALWQTLYLREHNRVARKLARLHPSWDDEHLFQTAKLIVIGKTLRIVVEDYIQKLSNYHFKMLYDPTVMHGEAMQYQNRIAAEFNLLYHWHPLMADSYTVSGRNYHVDEIVFNGTALLNHPSRDYVEGLVKAIGGSFSHNNHPDSTLWPAKASVRMGRSLHLQSLNAYRRHFRLKPYESFEELIGDDKELISIVKGMYKDIDAVEFYPGLVVEQHRPDAMFGSSMMEFGSPYSLQGIFGNALSSPQMWRPSTFGGSEGFRMVKEATLKDFVCDNLPGPCPLVQFGVPTKEQLEEHEREQRENPRSGGDRSEEL